MGTAVIPEPIASYKRQLDQFRSTQPRGRHLPESVSQAAVELAREHGDYSVAHPLRLDFMGLKKRLGGVSYRRRKARQPAWVEAIAPQAAMLRECVIEFESLRGSKVRIQGKAAAPPDWLSLLRAWRKTERRFGSRRRCASWWLLSRSMEERASPL
jgi:hypothetical protein